MLSPLFAGYLPSLDVIYITNSTRKQPWIWVDKDLFCMVIFAVNNVWANAKFSFYEYIVCNKRTHLTGLSWSIEGKFIIFDNWSVFLAMSINDCIFLACEHLVESCLRLDALHWFQCYMYCQHNHWSPFYCGHSKPSLLVLLRPCSVVCFCWQNSAFLANICFVFVLHPIQIRFIDGYIWVVWIVFLQPKEYIDNISSVDLHRLWVDCKCVLISNVTYKHKYLLFSERQHIAHLGNTLWKCDTMTF